MRWRRGLLLAMVLYAALDLALPVMPAAFVFEAEDSVDRLEIERTGVLPALTRLPCVWFQLPIDVSDKLASPIAVSHRVTPTTEPALWCCVMARLPRAALDATPSTEDSH